MRRILSLILVFVLCMSLCACGGSNKSITVIKASGGSENMTVSDFTDLYENNQVKFNKNYSGCSISGSGKITQVEYGLPIGFTNYTNSSVKDGVTTTIRYCTITIDKAIFVVIEQSLAGDFEVGQTVSFNGKFHSVVEGNIAIYDYHSKTPIIS